MLYGSSHVAKKDKKTENFMLVTGHIYGFNENVNLVENDQHEITCQIYRCTKYYEFKKVKLRKSRERSRLKKRRVFHSRLHLSTLLVALSAFRRNINYADSSHLISESYLTVPFHFRPNPAFAGFTLAPHSPYSAPYSPQSALNSFTRNMRL